MHADLKLILITEPNNFENEVEVLNMLFQEGLEYLHLRKPDFTIEEMRAYIKSIPSQYHNRIRLHSHYSLLEEFDLGGAHFNSRSIVAATTATTPTPKKTTKSYSAHTIEELQALKSKMDYLFLSPIFDSISKQGYKAAFSQEELVEHTKNKIIDNKVIALGGINLKNIEEIKSYGFGGIAMIGGVWNEFKDKNNKYTNIAKGLENFKQIKRELNSRKALSKS